MLEFFNIMTVLNINNITLYLIEYLVKGLFLAKIGQFAKIAKLKTRK